MVGCPLFASQAASERTPNFVLDPDVDKLIQVGLNPQRVLIASRELFLRSFNLEIYLFDGVVDLVDLITFMLEDLSVLQQLL